jgi:hypothetical protein
MGLVISTFPHDIGAGRGGQGGMVQELVIHDSHDTFCGRVDACSDQDIRQIIELVPVIFLTLFMGVVQGCILWALFLLDS